MLKLKQLRLKNFLSFGGDVTVIDFTDTGTFHVLGENLDTTPVSASGAGKTTIINAVAYALFGRTLIDVSKDLVMNTFNRGKQAQMLVELDMEVAGDEVTVSRSRGSKAAISLTINGQDVTPDSVANFDKRMVELVGMSFDLFTRTVAFTGSDQSFFEMKLSEQRDLLEELFRITALSEKADKLKEVRSALDKDAAVLEARITALKQTKALREKHITDAATRVQTFEDARQTRMIAVAEKLAAAETVGDVSEQIDLAKNLRTQETTLLQTQQSLKSQKHVVDAANVALTKKKTEYDHLSLGACPFCKQKFNDELLMLQLGQEIDLATVALAHEQLELDQLTTIATAQGESVAKLRAKVTVTNPEELMALKNSIDTLQAQLVQIEQEENPHVQVLEQMLAEDDVVIDTDALDEMKSESKHCTFLLKLLTDRNSFIRKKIIAGCIPLLNKQLLTYTTELGLPHIIQFTADMDVEISEFGRELSFGNLSGGERARVNLALSLAFRDVMSVTHGGVNVMFADEVDAGKMDGSAMDALIGIMRRKAASDNIGIWCISHRLEIIGRLDKQYVVRKSGGFSAFCT